MIQVTYPEFEKNNSIFDVRSKASEGGYTTSLVDSNNQLVLKKYAGECRDSFHLDLYSKLREHSSNTITFSMFISKRYLGNENDFKKAKLDFYSEVDGIPHADKIKLSVINEELFSNRGYWSVPKPNGEAVKMRDTVVHDNILMQVEYPVELLADSMVPWILLLALRDSFRSWKADNLREVKHILSAMKRDYSKIILTDKPDLILNLWRNYECYGSEYLTFNGPNGIINWGYTKTMNHLAAAVARLDPVFNKMHKYVDVAMLSSIKR